MIGRYIVFLKQTCERFSASVSAASYAPYARAYTKKTFILVMNNQHSKTSPFPKYFAVSFKFKFANRFRVDFYLFPFRYSLLKISIIWYPPSLFTNPLLAGLGVRASSPPNAI